VTLRSAIACTLILTVAVACHIRGRSRRSHWEPRFQRPSSYNRGPRLRQSDEEIEQRLAHYEERQRNRQNQMPPAVRNPDLKSFKAVVSALDWSYRRAVVSHANELLSRYQKEANKIRIMSFDDPTVLEAVAFTVEYKKHGTGGRVHVTVKRRPGFKGLVAVAFPPGTYGRPYIAPTNENLYGDWPPARRGNRAGTPAAQDLVFLAARIAWLDPDVDDIDIHFPVSCGRFNKGAPRPGDRYLLVRFDEKNAISRLAIETCALNSRMLNHASAQMAIWIVRDGLTWKQYLTKKRTLGPSMTFETARVITDEDAMEASDLLLDAGIDPRKLPFYRSTAESR
jgi:hypothetical protein